MKNERNAGRKPVPEPVRYNATVPKYFLAELKKIVKEMQKGTYNTEAF